MNSSTKPWEKRARDLSFALKNCAKTYFDPDLFRRNTNYFLQTARTVTFIIQKNKSSIPNFDKWYQESVVTPWSQDKIMKWAKEARNVIEKEGDLELNSHLSVTMIYSYFEEEDIDIPCGKEELINANVKRLIRVGRRELPSGVSADAAVKIERQWRTKEFPDLELLHILSYIYVRVYRVLESLAEHTSSKVPDYVETPSTVSAYHENGREINIVKLKDYKSYRMRSGSTPAVDIESLSDSARERIDCLKPQLSRPTDFMSAVDFHVAMAESVFEEWGFHDPMVFLYAEGWVVNAIVHPVTRDQSDKIFFWRTLAERVRIQKLHCVTFVAEAWIRDPRKYPLKPVSQLPVIGEVLQLAMVDADGHQAFRAWDISREEGESKPSLSSARDQEGVDALPNFLAPVIQALKSY